MEKKEEDEEEEKEKEKKHKVFSYRPCVRSMRGVPNSKGLAR